MNILLFGASGLTGKCLTEMAIQQGHQVTAFVRNPAKISFKNENLRIIQGNLNDLEALEKVISNHKVVISALGPTTLNKTNSDFMQGIENIVKCVEKHSVTQFFYLSTMGVGDSRDCLDWFSKYFIMDFIIKKSVEAHSHNEQLIEKSETNWYIFRPAKLNNQKMTAKYRVSEYFNRAFRPTISRMDVAHLMLSQLGNKEFLQRKVSQMY